MSFGYAVGDFIAVGRLAWDVYKAYKGAPDSFKNISAEILSLHALLKEIEESILPRSRSPAQQSRLETIYQGCSGILEDLDALIKRYNSLSIKNKLNWDRLGWGTQDIAEYRARLTSNIGLLSAFISVSQATVEKQLETLLQDYQRGNRESSIKTVESITPEDKVTWRLIRKELEDVGITVAAFDANKSFILKWFVEAIESGAFDEQVSCDTVETDAPGGLSDHHESRTARKRADEANHGERYISDIQRPITPIQPSTLAVRSHSPVDSPPNAFPNPAQNSEAQSDAVGETRPNSEPLGTFIESTTGVNETIPSKKAPNIPPAAVIDEITKPDTQGHSESQSSNNSSISKLRGQTRIQVAQRTTIKNGPLRSLGRLMTRASTNLYDAVSRADIIAVQTILQDDYKASLISDRELNNQLRRALFNENLKMANTLIFYGADFNAQVDDESGDLLKYVTKYWKTKSLELLLKRGVDVNQKGGKYGTALQQASYSRNFEATKLLIDHGADVNIQGGHYGNALQAAFYRKEYEIVTFLMEQGADVNARGGYYGNALQAASITGSLTTVKLLLENGADVNTQGGHYGTALQAAAHNAPIPVVKFLLEKGADVNAEGGYHGNALQAAAYRESVAIVRLLVEKGANGKAEANPMSFTIKGLLEEAHSKK